MSGSSGPSRHEQWEVVVTTILGMASGLYFQASSDVDDQSEGSILSRPNLVKIEDLAGNIMDACDDLLDAITRDRRDAAPPDDGYKQRPGRMFK